MPNLKKTPAVEFIESRFRDSTNLLPKTNKVRLKEQAKPISNRSKVYYVSQRYEI